MNGVRNDGSRCSGGLRHLLSKVPLIADDHKPILPGPDILHRYLKVSV